MNSPAFQQPCEPVTWTFGDPIDHELFYHPEMRDEHETIALNVQGVHARHDKSIETGEAAQRAVESLGCTACSLAVSCPVRTILTDKIESAENATRFADITREIVEAPDWLAAARLNNPDVNPERLQQIASDQEVALEALMNGELETYISGVTSKPAGNFRKTDLPEIALISAIKEDATLEAYDIQTETGHRYTVIDASGANTSRANDSPEDRRRYFGILCEKFVGRLQGTGKNGLPLVLQPDSKQQKAIQSYGLYRMDEMRKAGKDRMYFMVTRATYDSDITARIVLLGSHGGNEATQQTFIDDMQPSASFTKFQKNTAA